MLYGACRRSNHQLEIADHRHCGRPLVLLPRRVWQPVHVVCIGAVVELVSPVKQEQRVATPRRYLHPLPKALEKLLIVRGYFLFEVFYSVNHLTPVLRCYRQ
jgi:hypothetical protein